MKTGLRQIRLDLITAIGERKKAESKIEQLDADNKQSAKIIKALRNCSNCSKMKFCPNITCYDSKRLKDWTMGVKVDE
jgi:hypothetical protein